MLTEKSTCRCYESQLSEYETQQKKKDEAKQKRKTKRNKKKDETKQKERRNEIKRKTKRNKKERRNGTQMNIMTKYGTLEDPFTQTTQNTRSRNKAPLWIHWK